MTKNVMAKTAYRRRFLALSSIRRQLRLLAARLFVGRVVGIAGVLPSSR
jgi:hypothetical protein